MDQTSNDRSSRGPFVAVNVDTTLRTQNLLGKPSLGTTLTHNIKLLIGAKNVSGEIKIPAAGTLIMSIYLISYDTMQIIPCVNYPITP
jgi:hypothetical protein